jgi:hypothetical protein
MDRSFTLLLAHGAFAAGLGSADEGGPALLVFRGTGHSVRLDADGSRTVRYGISPVEDLCKTLAA